MTISELKEKLIDTVGLLNVPGVGRGRFHQLLRTFGNPAAVREASLNELEAIPGISRKTAYSIKNNYDSTNARAVASRIIQLGWTVLFPNDKEFPFLLKNITSIPPLLFRVGDPAEEDDKMIAIVGTRSPSENGKLFASDLAAALARTGITVVSGMAEGIDARAHQGAIDGGGKTVAVWGSSLDIVYPPSHKTLADRIKKQGAIYSEYFPGTNPDRAYFPERNRIISGLSYGVVVVEAARKSGALITAQHAIEQNRDVFAVPGSPRSRNSAGTNELIKKGARLITTVDDIFDELPRLKGHIQAKKFTETIDLTETERKIVNLFSSGPMQIDYIARLVDLPVEQLAEFL